MFTSMDKRNFIILAGKKPLVIKKLQCKEHFTNFAAVHGFDGEAAEMYVNI